MKLKIPKQKANQKLKAKERTKAYIANIEKRSANKDKAVLSGRDKIRSFLDRGIWHGYKKA